MNMLRRAQAHFAGGRDDAVSRLRQAGVVSSDETGVRIEGSNAYHWVFRCDHAVVHTAAPTRGAIVVRTMMDGHRPDAWCSDAMPPSRVMPMRTKPASPISRVMSPMRSRTVKTSCRCGSNYG